MFFANKYLYFFYQAGVFANKCLYFFYFFYQAGAEEQEGLHQARDQTRRASRSYFLLRRAEGLWSGRSWFNILSSWYVQNQRPNPDRVINFNVYKYYKYLIYLYNYNPSGQTRRALFCESFRIGSSPKQAFRSSSILEEVPFQCSWYFVYFCSVRGTQESQMSSHKRLISFSNRNLPILLGNRSPQNTNPCGHWRTYWCGTGEMT